jgi:hypothetical protein
MKTKEITLASVVGVMFMFGAFASQSANAQTASDTHISSKSQSKAERKAARKQRHYTDQKKYGKDGYR